MAGNHAILDRDGAGILLGGLGNDARQDDTVGEVIQSNAGAARLAERLGGDRFFSGLLKASTLTLAGNHAFRFMRSAASTGQAGQLHTRTVGGGIPVSGDVTGDRPADFGILIEGPPVPTANCFLL